MSMELCVLGSGSSGNCSVVRLCDTEHAILLDAGFGPRATAKRLVGTGVTLGNVRAIMLTHLDHDHFSPNWYRTLLERQIPIYLHQRHVKEFYEAVRAADSRHEPMVLHRDGLIRAFTDQPFDLRHDQAKLAAIRPIALSHDSQGTYGYVIRRGDHRIGYATDLGHVPADLLDAMRDVHLLALESNYDHQMELQSARPWHCKQRVISNHGHLSNDQALQAITHLFTHSRMPPMRIVLLHLSRQCNCPRKLAALYAKHPHIAGRLHLSSQYQRTPWLSITPRSAALPGEQIVMFNA